MTTTRSPTSAAATFKRLMRFPIARMVVAILSIGVAMGIGNGALALTGVEAWWARPTATIVSVHVAYVLFVRLYERRAVVELDRWAGGKEVILGFAGGLLLFSTVVFGVWALGTLSVDAWRGWSDVLPAFVMAAAIAYAEEVLFRGVIFRLVEATTGTWLAVAISAVLFGAMHIGNPSATVMAAGAVALEAGVLLAAAYVLTRRLWAPIGLHLGWNFAQGGVYGLTVSGRESAGLMEASLQGPTWITGGAFGVEASGIAVLLCSAAATLLLYFAYRKHRIAAAPWRNRQSSDGGLVREVLP